MAIYYAFRNGAMRAYESPTGGYANYDELDAMIALAESNRLAGVAPSAVYTPGQIIPSLASFQEQQARTAAFLEGKEPTLTAYTGGANPGFNPPEDLTAAQVLGTAPVVAAAPTVNGTQFVPYIPAEPSAGNTAVGNIGAATSAPGVAAASAAQPNFVTPENSLTAQIAPTYAPVSLGLYATDTTPQVTFSPPPAVSVFIPVAQSANAPAATSPVSGGSGGGGVSGASGSNNNGIQFVHPVSKVSGLIPTDWNRTGTASNGDPVFTVIDANNVVKTFGLDGDFQAYFGQPKTLASAATPATPAAVAAQQKEASTATLILGGLAFAAKAFLFS